MRKARESWVPKQAPAEDAGCAIGAPSISRGFILHMDGISNALADALAALVCDALSQGHCSYPPRLRHDHVAAWCRVEEELGNLSRLPATRFACDEHYTTLLERGDDLVDLSPRWQPPPCRLHLGIGRTLRKARIFRPIQALASRRFASGVLHLPTPASLTPLPAASPQLSRICGSRQRPVDGARGYLGEAAVLPQCLRQAVGRPAAGFTRWSSPLLTSRPANLAFALASFVTAADRGALLPRHRQITLGTIAPALGGEAELVAKVVDILPFLGTERGRELYGCRP
mmetsp:Transcript_55306/g.154029  ORF Transcript_55306/g.154029 Transcript_55306/m.154029 type:complete len:286 (-) Transcript_55306:128-985(-)